MSLPDDNHVSIGGVGFRLDEGYEQIVGRRCYVHGGRSLFAEQFNITGVPGARSLRQEDLQWHLTNFDGEGQVTLDASDENSARLFYRSEGLDFKVPGQFSLNKSSIATTVPSSPAAGVTYEGNAGMADVTGTSTATGTDRRLNATGDRIQTNANYSTVGASNVQVDFYLYRESFEDNDTSIAGSAMKLQSGDGVVTGADFRLRLNSEARTANKSTGTHFSAGVRQRVELYAHANASININDAEAVFLSVWEVTSGSSAKLIDAKRAILVQTSDNPTDASAGLSFIPRAGNDYQFRASFEARGRPGSGTDAPWVKIDEIRFGDEEAIVQVELDVYNNDTAAVVTGTTRTLNVNTRSAGNKVASIVFASGAGTNYRYRVQRKNTTGPDVQKPWVDKVVATELSTSNAYTLDCAEVGLGGLVWLAGHISGGNSATWKYVAADDNWGSAVVSLFDATASTNATIRDMAHSDSREYFLLDDGSVRTVTAAGTDVTYATGFTGAVGIAVCQNRLFIMVEGSGGVDISALPLDGAAVPYTSPASVTVNLAAGSKTPDTTLRQRICSTPTGVRFYVNYGDVTSKIFEVDGSSGAALQPRELADLGHGVEASSIAYEGGLTFIGGVYTAESDQTALSALWYIDANGVLERLGFLRADSPAAFVPVMLEPFQTDLFIIQGPYVWRYSLTRGGLFLEYQLEPTDGTKARSISVSRGRTFAQYEQEVIVTGTEGTYRQASIDGGNTFTSSINDLGLPGVRKTLLSIRVLTDDLASGGVVTVEYQLDQDGTWATAGVATSGAEHTFAVASEILAASFNTVQVRTTLSSTNGTATPVVRGIILTSSAADAEEYFDLVLRTEDEDSFDRATDSQASGSAKAAHLVALWRTGAPTTFTDGYANKSMGVVDNHRVQVRDFRDERTSRGEGRVVVTLKVLAA